MLSSVAMDDASETYSPEETARRRDDIVRRMIATPPQPKATKPPGSKRGRPPKHAKG